MSVLAVMTDALHFAVHFVQRCVPIFRGLVPHKAPKVGHVNALSPQCWRHGPYSIAELQIPCVLAALTAARSCLILSLHNVLTEQQADPDGDIQKAQRGCRSAPRSCRLSACSTYLIVFCGFLFLSDFSQAGHGLLICSWHEMICQKPWLPMHIHPPESLVASSASSAACRVFRTASSRCS